MTKQVRAYCTHQHAYSTHTARVQHARSCPVPPVHHTARRRLARVARTYSTEAPGRTCQHGGARLLLELGQRVGLDLEDGCGGGGGDDLDVARVERRGDRDGRGERRADDAGEHGGQPTWAKSVGEPKRMHLGVKKMNVAGHTFILPEGCQRGAHNMQTRTQSHTTTSTTVVFSASPSATSPPLSFSPVPAPASTMFFCAGTHQPR